MRDFDISWFPRLILGMFLRYTRICLVPLDLGCSNVRILGLPDCPVVEVLDGLLDGRVCPEGWTLLVVLTGLHEVMEDPGGFGLAHGVAGREVRELPSNEAVHLAKHELLGPTREVFLRIQSAEVIVV